MRFKPLPDPLEHTHKSVMAVGAGVGVMLIELIWLAITNPNVQIAEGLFRVVTPALLGTLEAVRQWRLEDRAWRQRDLMAGRRR